METTEKKYRNKPKQTDNEWLALDFTMQEKFKFSKGKLDIQNDCCKLIHWRDEFYLWRDGYYAPVSKSYIKKMTALFLMLLNKDIGEQQVNLDLIVINPSKIAAVIDCAAAWVHVDERTELNSWIKSDRKGHFISVNNGVIDLTIPTKPLHLDPSPKFFTLSMLPYDYDPAAKCPQWLEFLNFVMQNNSEYVRLLQQWAGYLLRNDLNEQKFLLCTGEGANGKGVFFKLIAAMVGKQNTSQVPLSQFAKQFALSTTIGKLVNQMTESSHAIEAEAEALLKAFVAGDDMTFDRKFKEPITLTPTAKIMIATNDLPRFGDKSAAIWRRINFVPFNVNIPEENWDKNLENKLKTELSGILNWAIEGLIDLNKNGFIRPNGTNDLIEEYRKDSDPCRAFLLENYRELNGEDCPVEDGIRASEIYAEYRKFCEACGYREMGDRNFGKQIKRLFPKLEKRRVRVNRNKFGVETDLIWSYFGITRQN